jgi:hypothetical protein
MYIPSEEKIIELDGWGADKQSTGSRALIPMSDSYYDRNKEARKDYQKEYYALNQEFLRRKREIQKELEPEKAVKKKSYQKSYYLANRDRLLAERKRRYSINKAS